MRARPVVTLFPRVDVVIGLSPEADQLHVSGHRWLRRRRRTWSTRSSENHTRSGRGPPAVPTTLTNIRWQMTDVKEVSRQVNRHLLRPYHTGSLLSYPLS